MGSAHLASRRWIWEQYDHMVMADTVQRPGGDAGVVRVHGTQKGLAISCDVTPRYCAADPFEGAKQAVAECWRNLTATGAQPLAITDCMNFGNPERPEIMGEFVGAIEGMVEACTVLDFPVVSGNVSLYNETNGVAIPPTPAIGGVGLIADIADMADPALKNDGDMLLLLGGGPGHLGQSIYLQRHVGPRGRRPAAGRSRCRDGATAISCAALIMAGAVSAVHDVSDGGLLVARGRDGAGRRIGGVTLEARPEDMPAHACLVRRGSGALCGRDRPTRPTPIGGKAAAVGEVPVGCSADRGGDVKRASRRGPSCRSRAQSGA